MIILAKAAHGGSAPPPDGEVLVHARLTQYAPSDTVLNLNAQQMSRTTFGLAATMVDRWIMAIE
jgi:hypothetical protein